MLKAALILTLFALPVAAQTANPAEDNIRQARTVLEKCIAALGGPAYLSYADMRQEGRGFGFYRGQAGSVGAPFVRLHRFPDKERFEFFRDSDWVIIHDGDKGWETTFRGTRAQDATELEDSYRRSLFALDLVLRQWYSDPRTALFYDGETIRDGKEVHAVTLISPENRSATLFIAKSNSLPVAKRHTYREPRFKEIVEEIEMYDNYRAVQGIMTPHLVTRTRNGMLTSQRFLRSVTYNHGYPDSLFIPPPLSWDRTKK